MQQTMQPVSVIVPTLNEAENILPLFQRIHMTLESAAIPYEIIVIDDHSSDETVTAVRRADPKYHARAVLKQGKPGKAFSLLQGFKAAEHDLVCMIDADLQYPPEAIKLMYHKLQYCEADIVVTERIHAKTSLVRRLFSATFNLLFTRLLFGIKYDTQSGLKLFRKQVLKTVTVEPSPWTFDLEFIVRALEQDYVIVSQQIPFAKRAAGVPKVHLLSATMEIASNSLRLWRNTSTKRVKHSYKYSELLQRSVNWLLVLLMVTALSATLVPAAKTSAATPATDSSANAKKNGSKPSSLQSKLKAAAQSVTTPTSSTTAAPAPSTTNSTAATPAATTTPAAAATTPAVATTASSTSPATTAKPAAATTSTSAPSKPATATAPSTTTTTPSSSDTSAGDGQTKSTKYYPTSKLSTNKTQSLLKLAASIFGSGAIFIALGAFAVAVKSLIHRNRRQPLRI